MKKSLIAGAAALAFGASAASAQITTYEQNFEGYDPLSPTVIGDDGWLVGANVFDEFFFSFLYNYFAFPAPNSNDGNGDRFSAVASGEGGAEQGAQQLSVFSDYNNQDHANGFYIDANFFREYPIVEADVGATWTFSFDAKLGNIGDNSDALASTTGFIKTIDPANGFSLTNNVPVDLTNADPTWQRYELSLEITPDLVGQLFQVGFSNLSTFFDPSGMFYDNILLSDGSVDCAPDVNGDGIVDNGDIGVFVQLFLAQDAAADFNADGIIDNGDIGAFVAAFLAGCDA